MLNNLSMRTRAHWFERVTLPRFLKPLSPGDVVIDCGANVGQFTEKFAARGATVYAFEPHPLAFQRLEQRFRGKASVHLFNQAVSTSSGTMKLYLRSGGDPICDSESSSLMAEKDNVSTSEFVEVEVVRFADFVRGVAPVKLVKMDIEGAEYDVLPDMIDTGAYRDVDQFVIETHERHAGLGPKHQVLLAKIDAAGITNMDLTWH